MIITLTKKSLIVCAVTVVLIAVCIVISFSPVFAAVYTGKAAKKLPVYGVETEEKTVALTFDAAWGADKTLKILDILEKYQVKATFFLVGFWLDKYPEETKAIAQSGCEIGNHSNKHLQMSKMSQKEILDELQYVNNKVKELTGATPEYFRAPFGDYNDTLIETAQKEGLTTVQWTVDSLDWKGLSATEITQRVIKRVKSGSIVLFHNNSENILEALPLVLANLINMGYKPATVGELVMKDNYYIDSQGIQHKNNNSAN